ncbi:hypothetical protein V6N12_031277 [Hibiscus sabdariffa]|uniref:RNase H type-1 domain-containing protein n=1 Tax=Hibiscus sabdariffa TaxID=183260 RepID=A0ABR2EA19_9ROSI
MLANEGFWWRPGINSEVRMLKDTWGGEKQIRFSCVYNDSGLEPIRCKEFMLSDRAEWDHRNISSVFNVEDTRAILSCLIYPVHHDTLVWGQHSSGGDASNIVAKLAKRELDRSPVVSHLWSSVETLDDHPEFSVVHVRRSLNRAAHGLAQWAARDAIDFRFDYDVPTCIEHIVIEDAIFGS